MGLLFPPGLQFLALLLQLYKEPVTRQQLMMMTKKMILKLGIPLLEKEKSIQSRTRVQKEVDESVHVGEDVVLAGLDAII